MKRSLEWADGTLRFLDQTRLPHEVLVIETADYRVVGEAIRRLQIRGAPAIGVAAAFGVVLAVRAERTVEGMRSALRTAAEFLAKTRPTAVNLFRALDRMMHAGEAAPRDREAFLATLTREAEAILEEDTSACEAIAEAGVALLRPGTTVLTHCNTGALATAGGGTALNVIMSAARQMKIARVYVDETRPLLQGARLTAWELLNAGVPATLITDSTAGFLMAQGRIDAVLVGADRIAANGDVANKIGTYTLAVLARAHGIPFYVCAPCSTIDLSTPDGNSVQIEEREAEEVAAFGGQRIAPAGIEVYNPAFDITPHHLITAIVTSGGVARAPYGASLRRAAQGGKDPA